MSAGARDAAVPERPRIVVVDDHHLFRAGVKAELAAHCEIVGEAPDPPQALAVIAATSSSVSIVLVT